MGKMVTRDMRIAAGVGLAIGVVGVICVLALVPVKPSAIEEAILIISFHEIWILSEALDIGLTHLRIWLSISFTISFFLWY